MWTAYLHVVRTRRSFANSGEPERVCDDLRCRPPNFHLALLPTRRYFCELAKLTAFLLIQIVARRAYGLRNGRGDRT